MNLLFITSVLGLTLGPSVCFLFRSYDKPTYHTHYTITKEALSRAAVRYITGTKDLSDETIDRNATAKLRRIFDKDNAASENFEEVIDSIINSMSNRFRDIYHNPTLLMADELISEGNEFLMDTRKKIIELAKDKLNDNFILEVIGRYLLALQMFYSNTNWIELNNNRVCANLGVTNTFPVELSSADEATCSNCNDTKEGDCNKNLLTNKLTSGYISYGRSANGGNKPYRLKWAATGKCSHGGNLDQSRKIPAKGGINKETPDIYWSPHYFLHDESGKAAIKATVHFLIDREHGLVTHIGNESFERIFRIKYQNQSLIEPPEPVCYNCFQSTLSLVFVIDNTGSMSEDIFQVRKQAISIVNKASSSQSSLANYILVTFNDPVSKNTEFKTSDGNKMVDKLNILSVDGGDDCPEYAFTGLKTAIMAAHNGSCVFLFTDADPKDYDLCGEIVDLIKRKNIHLVALLTGECQGQLKAKMTNDCIQTHQQPFSCTGKTKRSAVSIFDMFSGLGGTVIAAPDRDITTPLQTLLEKNLDIRYVYITTSEMDSTTLVFPVDDYIAVLTIEIIGPQNKEDIILLEPNGDVKNFTDRDTLQNVGKSTFFASVMEPRSGMWTLVNNKRNKWKVKVKGQGNVEITLHLMESVSSSLLDIAGKPVSGQNISVVATINGINTSSEVNYIVLYSKNHTEILREPVNVYKEFGKSVAVAGLTVPRQEFCLVIEGRERGNIFQRSTENCFEPVITDIIFWNNNGDLFPGIISNISFVITNYGTNAETFFIQANDDKFFILNPNVKQVLVGSGKSEYVSFQMKGGNPKSITTLTITVSGSIKMLQKQKVQLMVSEFIPPALHNISIGSMCSVNSLNFQNCSTESINVTMDIVSDLYFVYCKPDNFDVAVNNGSFHGLHSVIIRGDCCTPKFRLFVKDVYNVTVEKSFDFTDDRVFSSFVPEIKQPNPNAKETSYNKGLVYGFVAGGIVLVIIIVVITVICVFNRKKKSDEIKLVKL